MQFIRVTVVIAALSVALAQEQSSALRGIETADLDRSEHELVRRFMQSEGAG